jgi:hypothetical protein
MFGPSLPCKTSLVLQGLLPVATMTCATAKALSGTQSADFLAHRNRIHSKTSPGKGIFPACGRQASPNIHWIYPQGPCWFSNLWTSVSCATLSDLAGLCIWFTRCLFILIGAHDTLRLILFVSSDTAVWLTSVPTSRLTTLPLAWLPGTPPALTGLSPIGRHRLADGETFGTLNFKSYIHHSRRTHWL